MVWSLRSRGSGETQVRPSLAVSERNVDLKRFSPAEIAGVACRLLVIEPKRSVFNEPHEDAEIAIVAKRLKTVKEIKGNMRNSQTAERVEKFENEESQVGKVGECGFNVLKFFRATDPVFKCGLTFSDEFRKAERACVNTTSTLNVGHELVDPERQRCSTRLGARVPVFRLALLGSCLTRPCQSC